MRRRTFIQRVALGTLAIPFPKLRTASANSGRTGSTAPSEIAADVVIIGGGVGGFAAALAAARNHLRVILTEETDWLGGQLTAQAVPPDEHPWIESFGATRAYRDFRRQVRDIYRASYPLTAEARALPLLNPGNGGVSKLCCEPHAALAALEKILAPYKSDSGVKVLLRHKPVKADVTGDRVKSVTVRDLETGRELTLSTSYFIDATELGDLLPLTKTEYVVGAESQADTGELHAPQQAEPANQQAFTFCFAMDYLEGEDHTIDKPRDYEFWRSFVPHLTPPWPGKLLDWKWTDPITHQPRVGYIDPVGNHPSPEAHNLWRYRRIADRANFRNYASDITLVNWPQNDFLLGNLVDVPEATFQRHLDQSRQLSLSLLFWMQTEAPRPDGGAGWRGLRLRRDVVGTDDGLAKSAYIRESRRIKAEFTVLERHVGADARAHVTGKKPSEVIAAEFPDSVGVGSYRIDLHPSTSGVNYIDIPSLRFQIPLGALIPRRVENLLPGAKDLGTTHITNGCYRLHPVEWNIGEASGALAAFCLARKVKPREVRSSPKLLEEFQKNIQAQGIEIAWPR